MENYDLSKLSDDELCEFERLLSKITIEHDEELHTLKLRPATDVAEAAGPRVNRPLVSTSIAAPTPPLSRMEISVRGSKLSLSPTQCAAIARYLKRSASTTPSSAESAPAWYR